MLDCGHCVRQFWDDRDLHAHCRDKADHPYCVTCERLFTTFQALGQHTENSSVHRNYDYNDESEDESEDENAHCGSCNRDFVDNASLFKHLAASSRHNWCFVCSRDFATPTGLDQHLNSQVHKSRDLACPLCKNLFKTPSAMALHIEAGTCHNYTRQQVTRAVQSLKVAAPISISRRIQDSSGPSRTPLISYFASERAWNGYAYECYICHRCFNTLVSLNSHLASPAHDANEFNCPKCKRKFKLISGLVQHIESEACGIARFKEVEDFARGLSEQFGKLLLK